MDTTQPSLLLRIRNREDAVAWRTFDTIYRPLLERYARARGLRDADVEDVVQHCMQAVSDHIGSFDYDPAKGRFKSWLRTLVNNRVRSLATKRRESQADSAVMDRAVAHEESPEALFERLWDQEHLWHCLRIMKCEVEPQTFEAFRRYVIEEQPASVVCEELGLTRGNLDTIKWRMTGRLGDHMRRLLGTDDSA